jgi:hypothetical protein
MRYFILIQTTASDWLKRQQDALVAGMVEMRASGSRYPRILAEPAEVKATTCSRRWLTCCASRRHPSCLTRLVQPCESVGDWRCSRPIAAGNNPASVA